MSLKILVINSGSSSVKYQLFAMPEGAVLAAGLAERIGGAGGVVSHKRLPGAPEEAEATVTRDMADHAEALATVLDLLMAGDAAVIGSLEEIQGVGHRVVHGGEAFSGAVLVDDAVIQAIADHIPLAPLHNPANLTGITTARKIFPGVPQVAVFDTAFHQTMPPEAFRYAVPKELYTEHRVRKYGFHGTSHKFVTQAAAAFLDKELATFNCVTVHIGNGGSMVAVRGGRSVDTSMGMTPLAGLVMGTRSGDIDPALFPYLAENLHLNVRGIDDLLNKKSGLLGLAGSNDMRDIHRLAEEGSPEEKAEAGLALDLYVYRIRFYLGAYYAVLGRVDAVVFTAGVGENDPVVRERVCLGLERLGIAVDPERNAVRSREVRSISPERSGGSEVAVLVVPTNEELAIAKATHRLIG